MATLEELFIERITNGLKRKSITDPAKWACAHRILSIPYPGPWTFHYHPWLQELHLSKNEYNVGQKAAQMGFTETMLNIVFYKIDVEQVDCLYVLPAKTPDAGDFSAARFDPALELSPHLSKLFSDVKNVGHKRAGTTNLYIRGSKSRAGLKSLPAGAIILDEVDEFNQENIGLAFERSSGQKIRLVWLISTPRFEGTGINKYYEHSTKENYFFKCPHCDRFINLTFPESLEITADSLDDPSLNNSYLKCSLCNHKLIHETKPQWLANKYNNGNGNGNKGSGTGTWIPENINGDMRGFHVSQLYSTTVTPINLARSYLKSLQDPSDEQIFYNDKLGITHTVEGARLTNHQIESTKGNYLNGETPNNNLIITMGIDVGKFFHYEVDQWILPSLNNNSNSTIELNNDSRPRVLEIGKCHNINLIDDIMRKYRIIMAVIDANPERRAAYEFSQRFYGHVKMCFYGRGIYGKQIHTPKDNLTYDNPEPTITVDRTSWLDLALGRFRNNTIILPSNYPYEYQEHLRVLIRSYERDRDGNPYGRYIKKDREDHYAHARTYAEIALPFAAHLTNPISIKSPI